MYRSYFLIIRPELLELKATRNPKLFPDLFSPFIAVAALFHTRVLQLVFKNNGKGTFLVADACSRHIV